MLCCSLLTWVSALQQPGRNCSYSGAWLEHSHHFSGNEEWRGDSGRQEALRENELPVLG